MSIKVDKEKCKACGRCTEICPGNLLYLDEADRAEIRYPEDCWGCAACLKECRFAAIKYHLGADIGGTGTYLYTEEEGDWLHWFFVKGSEVIRRISVDRHEPNRY